MRKIAAVIIFLSLAFLWAGCTPKETTPVEPTPDLNAVRTESAKTVVAELTVDAALHPSATSTLPQVTVNTVQAPKEVETDVPAPAKTALDAATQSTPTATATNTKAPQTGGSSSSVEVTPLYQCKLIRQEIADGYAITPNGDFDVKWTIQNIGTATWTTYFDFKYAGGDALHKYGDVQDLAVEVKQWEKTDLLVDLHSPSEPGHYYTVWNLVDEYGTVVCGLYVEINVTEEWQRSE